MELHLSVLPLPQKIIFPELTSTPAHFILYGGTAIALRLGHRESIDFDFFSNESFDPDTLCQTIPYLRNAEILQKASNTLTCIVDRMGAVKFSFFGGLSLDYVCEPDRIENPSMKIASLIDLAGMKVAVIQKRAAAKDYIDIDALITKANIDLLTALAAGTIIYTTQFNPYISVKALTYFGEGDLKELPPAMKNRLVQAAKNLEIEQISHRVLELRELRRREIC